MKLSVSKAILSGYDLLIGIAAILTGAMMLAGKLGEYPLEWMGRTPFDGWMYPAIIGVVIYGIGNLVASSLSLKNNNNKGIIASGVMSIVLLGSILLSIYILGEVYLVTIQIIAISVIQLILTFVIGISSIKLSTKSKYI